ncbi:hypothetical protein NW858_13445, partial [Synechococcus sp. H55.10]
FCRVPPSGGSLEIGNVAILLNTEGVDTVPPSGGSLEIGNPMSGAAGVGEPGEFPLRGDP